MPNPSLDVALGKGDARDGDRSRLERSLELTVPLGWITQRAYKMIAVTADLSGRSLGDVMVASDDVPPSVSRLSVRGNRTRGVDLSFRTSDNLSGIEYERLKLYIDDHVVIPEIDGEHRRVVYRSSDPLGRGSHRLQIRVSDRAGNTSTVDRHFTVR